MSKLKVYKIHCEWDTDLTDMLFVSKAAAMRELEAYDWESLVEDSLANLLNDDLVSIEEITVHE